MFFTFTVTLNPCVLEIEGSSRRRLELRQDQIRQSNELEMRMQDVLVECGVTQAVAEAPDGNGTVENVLMSKDQ